MSIINSVSSFFSRKSIAETPLLDPTEYRIITDTHEYFGLITHQDDFSIDFQVDNKLVKILKSTIIKISVAPGKKGLS
jgi:hypothetical protein